MLPIPDKGRPGFEASKLPCCRERRPPFFLFFFRLFLLCDRAILTPSDAADPLITCIFLREGVPAETGEFHLNLQIAWIAGNLSP